MSNPELASDADRINIVMPVVLWKTRDYFLEVNELSRITYRKAVWKMAQYFRREFRFDFTQYGYGGDDDDPDCRAYLFCPWDCNLEKWKTHCIGAACFRKREGKMALQWVWFHPFYRRDGHLSKAWPYFCRVHGDFDVEGPVSDAMDAFLKKMNHKGRIT